MRTPTARPQPWRHIDWCLPREAVHLLPEELRRMRLVVGISLLFTAVSGLFWLISWALGRATSILILAACTSVAMAACVLLPRWTGSAKASIYVACLWIPASTLALCHIDTGFFLFLPVVTAVVGFLGGHWAIVGCLGVIVVDLVVSSSLLDPLSRQDLWYRLNTLVAAVLLGGATVVLETIRRGTEMERDGAVERLFEMAREQTVRLETEQQIQARLARHQALRGDIGAALSENGPLPTCLRRCCEAITRHLDAGWAGIWMVDASTGALELKAGGGAVPPPDGLDHVPAGTSGLALIVKEGKPYVTRDAPGDPRVEAREWAEREKMSSFVAQPLMVGGKAIGAVALFSAASTQTDTLVVLGVVADILAQGIQRERAELALARRAEDLARSNAELERFAYVASHDLQEPLRMVASYTQLLARRYQGKLDTRADEFIHFAVEGATRMQQLIQDLLTFARVGNGALTPSAVDTGGLLRQVLGNLQASLQQAGARVTFDPLPVVQGEATQLGQLFQNLIANALKFHAPGTAPHAHVSAERRGEDWVFSVRDNGIGIEPEYLSRLFVLFQRLHSTAEYPGTGIGLAICKKIVERHGGRIWVESSPGQGSTFFFTLPASRAAA